jgi:hypothetical protein
MKLDNYKNRRHSFVSHEDHAPDINPITSYSVLKSPVHMEDWTSFVFHETFAILSLEVLRTGSILKGQCQKIIFFRFFFMNHVPPIPWKYVALVISTFVENSRRYLPVNVHSPHWYQLSITPAVNLPPIPLVSLIPVENNGNLIRLSLLYMLALQYYPQEQKN